jgi:hypothetical protein
MLSHIDQKYEMKKIEIVRIFNEKCRLENDGGWIYQNNPTLNINDAIIWHRWDNVIPETVTETPEESQQKMRGKFRELLVALHYSKTTAESIIQQIDDGFDSLTHIYLYFDGTKNAFINQLYEIACDANDHEPSRRQARIAMFMAASQKNKTSPMHTAFFQNPLCEEKVFHEIFKLADVFSNKKIF